MLRIPKIIHQTWKDENLPKAFQLLSETWREMLPGWECHLWTDDMNREFVRTHYHDFLEKFDAYPKRISSVLMPSVICCYRHTAACLWIRT